MSDPATADTEEFDHIAKRQRPQCSVCTSMDAKYTCPRCSVKTCSLKCVSAHKQSSGCTGKRDPSVFISLAMFNDKVLTSDYRFLEEGIRARDAAERELASLKSARDGIHPSSYRGRGGGRGRGSGRGRGKQTSFASSASATLPKPRQDLLREANACGIRLKLLPEGMSRQVSNTSRCVRRTYVQHNRKQIKPPLPVSSGPATTTTESPASTSDCNGGTVTNGSVSGVKSSEAVGCVSWRVEWHFDNADPPIQIVSEGLLDNLPILDHIQSILSPEPCNASRRQKLRNYTTAPLHSLVFLLHHPYSVDGRKVFRRLEVTPASTLRTVLAGCDILEFPSISVLLPSLLDESLYPLLKQEGSADIDTGDSEDDDTSESNGESSDSDSIEDSDESGDGEDEEDGGGVDEGVIEEKSSVE